jgi:precorrin-2 dehydrogenase/sirohydrochlorin ferrochelatase
VTLPLSLDLGLLPAALAGAGQPLRKRLALLDGERIPGLTIFAPEPDVALVQDAGGRLVARLPAEAEIAQFRLLFVAGLPPGESGRLAGLARDHRVLVNVEDVLPLCDFHVPAILRRGDLAVAISTGGKSPTLARRLRSWLGELLPEAWEGRTRQLAQLRERMRAEGKGPREVMAAAEALIDREEWLRSPP